MSKDQSPTAAQDESTTTAMAAALTGVFVVFVVAIGFYIHHFGSQSISKDPEKWGQFGDYLGGVINPAVGLATVLLVVLSISIQRREIRASVDEMKTANLAAGRMSFEQSLFAWLTNYRDLVHSVSVDEVTGRRALRSLYFRHLEPAHVVGDVMGIGDLSFADLTAMGLSEQDPSDPDFEPDLRKLIQGARCGYSNLYREHQSELDALPRTIFRLLRWIDESKLSPEERWHYIALVRAQLSWTELVLFFYNCYTSQGRGFATLANKYALFDNLDAQSDFLVRGVIDRLCYDADEPLKPEAFSSQLAKKQLGLPEAT